MIDQQGTLFTLWCNFTEYSSKLVYCFEFWSASSNNVIQIPEMEIV